MKTLVALIFCLLLTNGFAQCNAFTGNDTTICPGGSVQLGALVTGSGQAPLTYTWSPATNLSCTICQHPTANPVATTTYTLTVEDANGCISTDNVTVNIANLPNSGFTFTPNNACASNPVQFTATDNTPGLSYSWNFGNPSSGSTNTSNLKNPAHLFKAVGNGNQSFTVTLTVANGFGCQTTSTQSITVGQLPDATLVDPLTSFKNCDGTNFTLEVFNGSTTTAGNFNYQIIWGDGTPDYNSTTFPTSTTHTYTTADIFDLYFIVTGTNGCTDTSHQTVSNITNPAIGAANPGATTGCGPLTLCFPLSNFAANHSSTIYVINYGDNSPVDTLPHPPPASLCHTYTQSSCGQSGNAFTFSIQAINLCDNSTATISPIRVYTGPQAQFNLAPNPGCVNTPITFNNTSTLGYNSTCATTTIFTWNFGDGATLTQFSLSNPTHVYTTPGNYTTTLSAQNACGTTTFTQPICIEAIPVPQFTITPKTGCVPLHSTVTNTSNTLNTCAVNRTWSVLFNGSTCLPANGSWNYANGTNQNSFQPEFNFTSVGTYYVRLTLTNSCGSFMYQDTVIVQGPPQANIPILAAICAGQSVAPTAVLNPCYESIDTYAWTMTGGTPSSSVLAIPGSVTYPNSGTFPIQLTVTNLCGLVQANTTITVNAPPVANAGSDVSFCSGLSASIGTPAAGGVIYAWTPTSNLSNGGVATPTASGTNVGSLPITNTYILTASTSPTCFSKDTVNITINPIPVLVVNNATICVGNNANLLVSGAGVGGNYVWTANPSLSCTNCDNPIASPIVTTTYSVTGTNSYNCSSSISTTVTVNPLPVVNAGPDQILCDQPIPVNLVGSPLGGSWTGSPNITSGGVFTPNGAEIANVVYTYTNPSTNCTNSDVAVITVNPAIIPTIDPLDSICINAGITNLTTLLNPNPTGGTFLGPGVTGANFNPITAGLGTHQIIYFYGNGTCQSSDTAQVIVNAIPALNSNNATICVGDTAIITINGLVPGGTYSWTPTTNLSCTNCSISNAWPVATTNYSITGTNLQGCSSTVNSTVTVNPLPVVNAGPNQLLCDQPVPVQLNGSPLGGTWTGSPNITSGGSFTPNGTENVNVIYAYTNPSTGCSSSDTVNIQVSPPVNPTLTSGQSICFEAIDVNLNTFLSPNPVGGTWSGAGVSGTQFTPSITGVGTHTISYVYGNATCQTTTTVDIVVNPQPTITTINDTICVGESTTLVANGAGVSGSYNWSPATNLSCTSCQNPIANPSSTTNYQVTGTNNFGCSNTATMQLLVQAVPVANAGPDSLLCNLPSPVQLIGFQAGGTWSGLNISSSGVFTPSGIGTFTVTYSVILGTGCQNSDSRIITVVDPAQADAGPDDQACISNSTISLVGNPALGTWSGTNITSAGVFSLNQSGTFSLVYSYGSGNCLTKDTMIFTVYALPIVNAGLDNDLCISEGVLNLSGSPVNGTWTGTGITNSTLGTFDPAVSGAGNFTITYTYTDPATTCVNSDQLLVNVHPLPVVNFTVDPIVCAGNSVPFTNTSTLIASSAWDFGDGATSSVNSPNHVYTTIGFFDAQLIVTTAFGCVDSITKTIEVREPPVANFSVSPDSLCGPLLASFNNLSSGISITYAWDFGNGQSSTIQNPADVLYPASLVSDTSYTINLSVTNYCGTVSHQESVIVMPQPVAIFGTDFNTGCSPFTPNIANTSVGLADNYYWDFGDGTTSTDPNTLLTHVFTTGASPTNYTIMLVAYNECGSDTAYHTITVLPNTVDAFFNTSAVSGCEDLTVDFTQYTVGGTFYNWNFGDGNTTTTYSPSHTFANPGTYTVALMANDGCSYDTTEVQITVFPSPVISFYSTPDSVCINSPFDFVNTSLNLANSAWDFGDGATSNLTNPSHQYANSGIYTVTLTGTSLTNGCSTQLSHTVNVSLNPVAAFVANPMSGCVPLVVQCTNTSTNAAYSYWDFGDGNTSGQINPQHTFTNPGVYTIQLIVENSNGCKDSIIQNITVHPLPIANFTYTSTSTCYSPTDFTFTNQSSGAINYDWNFGDGNQSNLTNPTHTYQNPGTYTITLIATNQYGCLHTTTQSVTIYPTPEAAFILPDDVVCENDVLLFQSNSNFADSIVWDFGNGEQLTGSSVSYDYPYSGSYFVTIMAYGAGGCGDTLTLSVPITVNPDPVANFDYVNVQIPDPVSGTVEFTNLSQDANSYSWQFGNGTSSTETNPVHRYNSYGNFNVLLIASNSFGCVDSIYKDVRVTFFNGLYLPNAMYPDHASYEVSHFVPKGVGLKTFLVQIYDDWGNVIWESNALDPNGRPTEAWDGTYKGTSVQQDAYVWKVVATFLDETIWEGKEYADGIFKGAGTVTVIR